MAHIGIAVDWTGSTEADANRALLCAFRQAARDLVEHIEVWGKDALHSIWNEYQGIMLSLEEGCTEVVRGVRLALAQEGRDHLSNRAHGFATAFGA